MNKNKKSPLAEKLIALRTEKGMTQSQIAEAINIKRSTYAYYECATMPPADILKKLARLFDTTVDFLLGSQKAINRYSVEPIDSTLIFNQDDNLYNTYSTAGSNSSDDKIFLTRYKLLSPELKQKAQEYMSKLINEMDK